MLPQLGQGGARRVVRERLLERLQPEQDRGQRLPGLVVELAREPAALDLLRLHDAPDRIPRHALRQLDGDGGAGGERLGQAEVVVGEAGVGAFLVVDLEHADRLVARDQRHPHAGARAGLPRHLLVAPPGRRSPSRCARCAGARAPRRSSTRNGRWSSRAGPRAPATAANRSSSPPLGSASATTRAPSSSRRRRTTRSSSRSRSVSVASALPTSFSDCELARPAGRRLVEARVLDRHRSLAGEQRDELLVLVGEVLAALLLGEVEVAVGDAAQHDRHAEEAVHRWMSGREADRTRILGQVVQPQRLRLADQHAEDAATARQRRRSPRAGSSSIPWVMNCSSSEPLASITPSAA